MKITSKLRSLLGIKSSKDEHASAEKLEIAKTKKKKLKSHYFVLQTLEVLKKLELDGGIFICSSPDFKCYFKKEYMSLFEGKNAYIKVAFDKADNVTHVCGLMPRLQHEKDRKTIKDENITLSRMPDCLLSHAIAQLSLAPNSNITKAGNDMNQSHTTPMREKTSKAAIDMHQSQTAPMRQQTSKAGNYMYKGQTASMRHQTSNLVFDPYVSDRSLKQVEKEWLNSMRTSLIGRDYEILLHLLQHSIIVHGFQETIEHFLSTKKELEPGSCSLVINSFKYLAREFLFNELTISVAQIGSRLEQMFNLKPKEIFSVLVELFFCMGYEKEIKGYTTGFIELN